MQRVLSTYLFVNRKLTPALLSEIARAGFRAVEVFCSRIHFGYRLPQEVGELASALAGNDLTLHSLHGPTDRDLSPGRESGLPISLSDPERVRRLDAVDEIKRALDVAEHIPFSFLVQHMGSSREPWDPRRRDAAFTSLEHLMVFAKQRGVTIALENTPGELGAPENLKSFVEETRLHDLRFCFDTGHAHMGEGIERSFEAMREHVVTTHVHDNHGGTDEHLFPYDGTIEWTAALQALSRGPGGQELPIVLEIKEKDAQVRPLERAAAVLEKFEQALAAEA